MKSFLSLMLLAVLTLATGGCGSISTHDLEPTSGPAPQKKPAKILVLPFASDGCQWALEVSSADEAMIRSGLPDRMASAAVRELEKIAPSSKADGGEGRNAWLVQGRLRKVILPDPAFVDSKRKPVVECTVFVFDLNRSRIQPFMTYDIVAKDVGAGALAESSEEGAAFLQEEAKECANLLSQSLQDYIKNRSW